MGFVSFVSLGFVSCLVSFSGCLGFVGFVSFGVLGFVSCLVSLSCLCLFHFRFRLCCYLCPNVPPLLLLPLLLLHLLMCLILSLNLDRFQSQRRFAKMGSLLCLVYRARQASRLELRCMSRAVSLYSLAARFSVRVCRVKPSRLLCRGISRKRSLLSVVESSLERGNSRRLRQTLLALRLL